MTQESSSERLRQTLTTSIPNPMDWQPIDRLILLALLVLFAPVCFGLVLIVTNEVAPEYLNQTLVPWLLWGCR